jgi:hypothetical protein
MGLVFAQSCQNGTDICLKLNVTGGKFVVKNWQALLILVEKFLNMLMLVRKFFSPPPVDNISGKTFYDLVKILLNVGQNSIKCWSKFY